MNVLEKIVADKRIEVAQRKIDFPLERFKSSLQPSEKDMYAALDRKQSNANAGFILECKKASPSKGLIRSDFDVASICKVYDKYAAAISVLTDEKYFQGTFDYLKTVTDIVSCPVLNKDFFVDTYQVYLARHYGADAILLMLSVLNDEEYQQLESVAKSLNLAILTEVSNDEELTRAITLNTKLIGINNRNLRDLSTDISRTFDFAPKIPADRIVISESGIYTNDQVRELAPAVDGFLVGSSVMAQDDIDLACRTLIYGNNKVCGLTAAEYAQSAVATGAQFGGLIFAEKSPRCVSLSQAQSIVNSVPSLNYVGVYVNESISNIVEHAKALALFAVQLHGEENQEFINELKAALSSNCQIWKAVKVENAIPPLTFTHVDHWVLDGKNPGSGEAFGWQSLTESEQLLSTCMLAGGLGQDNINSALALQSAQDIFGLDINSGVEDSPGVKSREKLNSVFTQIRNY